MNKYRVKIFDKTFWKFILVGVINTGVGTAVMFLLYNIFGCSYWVSSASNYFLGSIVSYFLNKNFTFENKSNSPKVLVRFVVNITLCYFIAYGCAKPIVKFLLSTQTTYIQDNVSMLFGMGFFIIINYFGQRFFAFKDDN